jgi:RNA polymerase sigma factor (sigma-70 family)
MKAEATNKILELTEYYTEQKDRLIKRVSYRAGGIHNAEDVVHEAFTRALQYIDAYDPQKRPLPAWFNTILNNALKDFKRAERNAGTTQEEQIIEDLDMEIFKSEVVEELINQIEAMKDPAREILQQFVVLGYTAKEVVQTTDLNIHTVRKCIADFYKSARDRYATVLT